MYVTDSYLKSAAANERKGNSGKAQNFRRWYLEDMARLRSGSRVIFGEWNMVGGIKPSPLDVRVPLTWLVLHREGNRLLLLSEHCVDWEFYDGSGPFLGPAPETTWEQSTLRTDLNGKFYDEVFEDCHKALICTTTVQTADNYCTGTRGGKTTRDKLFLLSIEEVLRYLCRDTGSSEKSREDRYFAGKQIPGDIDCSGAAALLPLVSESYNVEGRIELECEDTDWWLRSPGGEQSKVACVRWNGTISPEGYHADCDEIGIRPAMWIDLDLLRPEQE